MFKHKFSRVYGAAVLIALFALVALVPVFSQDEGSITIMGTLDSIAADSVTVDGVTYTLADGTALPDVTMLGQQVILSARPDATTGSIVVLSISPATTGTDTPVPTVMPETPTDSAPSPQPTTAETPTVPPVPPTMTMTPVNDGSGDVIIVLEGSVQTINVNIVTIYNITVELAQNDPILVDLVTGDILRVVGRARFSGFNIVVFSVTTVNIVNVNYIFINPGVGGGIPAGCKVTKKGKIKCTKKSSKKSS